MVIGAIAFTLMCGNPMRASDMSPTSSGELSVLSQPGVVLEWLEFRVDATEREEFLLKDEQVWTAALRQQPGFLHKSSVLSPNNSEFVGFLIYWANREEWKAFPEELIIELDRQMQPTSAELISSREYPVWSHETE